MLTHVTLVTNAVKRFAEADDVRSQFSHHALVGLAERIQAIQELRGWTGRELCRQAGIAEAHLAVMMGRLKKDPEAASRVALETILKIAEAGRVRLEWLATGEEPMLADSAVDYDAQRPELSRAVRMFRTGYESTFGAAAVQEAIARVDGQFKGMPDLDTEWWLAKLVEAAKTVRAERAGKAAPPAGVEDELEDEIAAHRAKKPGK